MIINEKKYRTIWEKAGDPETIQIIDQRLLPHTFKIKDLNSVDDFIMAISEMYVRGAPLIGVTASYGMYIATIEASKSSAFDKYLIESARKLIDSRPTAVNLEWAVFQMLEVVAKEKSYEEKTITALNKAREITENDVGQCRLIGKHGYSLIEEIAKKKNGKTVNILTHCNAGWLATVDHGTATAPIYHAFHKGIKLHVWVDETRPRNQGAKLTSWELNQEGVPNTIIVDNAGGHLMQHGFVDIVIVGSDRTTYTGDVANKIGTYLKALAAKDNEVPFYVALSSSTIDWKIKNGVQEIPIEERNKDEVRYVDGLINNEIKNVLVTPAESKVANYAFDVTPGRLVTGLITERGICKADKDSIFELFPEKRNG
ncbi:S-methyl-5-thioribose-1-phosphate isomerase [Bacteroidota bacterium]